ncbi:MAG: hypothetical protein IK078_04805 [Lachnospiraceae bacterium]|nr:hypothetical protein [Lachnospiraceae bacterium]
MEAAVMSLFESAFIIWNGLVRMAMTLFTTSPKAAAGGSPYATMHTLYNSISAATIPVTTCFFLIAIYKTVISTPSDQQLQRFFMDALRYCIILFVASHLWEILGYIIEFADGITASMGSATSLEPHMSGDLERIIHESLQLPAFELSAEWIARLFEVIGTSTVFLIGGLTLILTMVASALSIISSAFQRILKPLIIMPFAGIAVAMGAGGAEISRSLWTYFKTFLGFCISGAMMVVIIKCGSTLCTSLTSAAIHGSTDIENAIIITLQAAITPIVTAGLVKSTDSIISRML